MPFDVNTAKVEEGQPSGGFDIGSAQVVTSAKPATENVFREETGEVISAPSDFDGLEIEYMDDVQNRGVSPQAFLGFAKVGTDHVTATGKGLTNFFMTVPAMLEGSARMQVGDARQEVLSRPFKKTDLLAFIPNPFSSRDDVIANATISRLFMDLDEENEAAAFGGELSQSGLKLIERNREWVKENGFERPEGSEGVAFDIGSVFGSIGTSVGMAILTRSPALSAVFFGELQKSDSYVEAREKGFSPEAADNVSSIMGIAEGGLELIGMNYFLKASGAHKGLRLIGFRMLEESLQEGSQQTAEEIISQTSGLREIDVQGGVGRVLYSMVLGAIGGGTTASLIEAGKKIAKEEGVPQDIVPVLAQKIEENGGDIEVAFAEMLDQEGSALRDDPQSSAQVAQMMRDFSEGRDIDISKLSEQDQKFVVDSLVDLRLRQLDAQSGANMLPVPKRPETLSQFLKKAGGLRLDTGEARRFTRKDSPALKGVANRNGKLSLDEARALAVEAGFLRDTAYEDGVSVSTEQDLIDALEQEAMGVDVVRDSDFQTVELRNQIMEFNSQQDQANMELLEGVRELKSIKAAFKEGVRLAKKDVKATQTVLINALEAAKMRAEDRAKFIRQIKNIQTPEQLQKAAPEIEQKVSELLDAEAKRKLRKRIKKAISAAKKSDKLAVDVVEQIRRLEEKFLDNGILGKGFRELEVRDFQDAFAEVSALMLQGKAKLTILQEMKKQRRAERLEDLADGSRRLSNIDLKRAPLGERLSALDKFKNIFIEGANRAQRFNLNKNPMDVIFDIMDGYADYKGPNHRIFKQTIDKAYSNFLQLKERTTREVKDLADELKLKDHNFERIGAYAAAQQEGGIEKLKASGISQAEIDALQLNEKEMRMYQLMREKLDSLRPALKEVMRVVYNKDFKNVKEYFPFMTDFKAMNGLEIQEMFGDDAFLITDEKADFNKKDVKKGFTEERTGGKQKIRIDAMGVFLSHVENATYLIEIGQDIKELGEMSATDDFNLIAGDLGQEVVVDWINLLARKGRMSGHIDALDAFRINTGAAVLGFKLSSALIQPTALMDGSAFVGGDYVSRGVVNVTQREWRAFLKEHFPEIRERVGDDPAYLDMGGDKMIAKAREAGFWALKNLDLMAASAVASGAYVKSVESRGGKVDFANPDPVAIAEAQLAVRRSQSSAFAKDVAPIISQGKLTGNVSIDKLILQFQSFMLNRWSMIQHDFAGGIGRKGSTAKAMNVAVWLVLANMAEYSIRHWTKELVALLAGTEPPENDDEWPETVARQALGNVPFVGTLVNSAQYGSVPVPSISMMEKAFESYSYAVKSKSDEKKIKHITQGTIVLGGSVLGIPGTLQAQQLSKGLFDDGSGKSGSGVFNP